MGNTYEVIIVGGGPAGLTAGLYASRARLRTLLIEKGIFGGQIANAAHVENYPGFPDGISGLELGELMHRQAKEYGLETVAAEVYGIALAMGGTVIETTEGDYLANAVIIATGAEFNRLGVPGEERLSGKGVSYCATCDGPFFKDRVVAVVGGGDSAVEEGILLTRFASEVILIHRRDQLRASRLLQERAFANKKMAFLWDTVVEEILGNERVTGLRVRNVKTGSTSTIEASAAFIYVGQRPNTDCIGKLLSLDEEGRIPTDGRMETEIKGIFAAGDIRKNSSRQAITAAGDGATAAISAEKFLIQQ
ncbi:MAG: thioredoxin-disulfide reductase [Dehalococcoidia bacterium]|nr:MAG: thioredoxin-disulfide reductase [Dehalococcoidia bacterium]